jgi:hypothetical protein
MHIAEQIERRTKGAGSRIGALGLSGLAILRILLRHANASDGLCMPSYDCLQSESGFARQTIASCLRRLEQAGIIKIARRLIRQVIDGVLVVRQASNCYAFNLPAQGQYYAALGLPPTSKSRALPARSAKMASDNRPRAESTEQGVINQIIQTQAYLHMDWRQRARLAMQKGCR